MEKTNSQSGVFLNGKNQIIEMLQLLPREERVKLLNNIKSRNPQMAEELMAKSFSFNDISSLSDNELSVIFRHIKAPVLGMALKNLDRIFQRRLLSLAEREYAEEAFRVMTTTYVNEKTDCKRAQNRILEILVTVIKK